MSYYSELTIASEFLGKNLDLSYNFDYAFMIDLKCKVLFCSIFHSGLILRFYGQGSKSRNFPKGTYIANRVHVSPMGYMYFQQGTCISKRLYMFPLGYMYFQQGTCISDTVDTYIFTNIRNTNIEWRVKSHQLSWHRLKQKSLCKQSLSSVCRLSSLKCLFLQVFLFIEIAWFLPEQ